MRERRALRVDGVGGEADRATIKQEREQPRLLAHDRRLSSAAPRLRSARVRGAGVTSRTPTASTRYEPALIAKDGAEPRLATQIPASAGPIARARLYVIELSATADCRCSRGTRSDGSAMPAGAEKALMTPSATAKPMTSATEAWPPR